MSLSQSSINCCASQRLTEPQLNMWEFLGRGFTRIERTEGADVAPYMTVENLDPAFYDFEKTPVRHEPAPTATQARAATLKQRPSRPEARNGLGSANAKEGTCSTGFANGEPGQVNGFTGALNYHDEVSETQQDEADQGGLLV